MLEMANALASSLQPPREFQLRSLSYAQTVCVFQNIKTFDFKNRFRNSRYQDPPCPEDAEYEAEGAYFPLGKGDAPTPLPFVPVGGITLGSIYSKLSEKGQYRLLEVLPGKPGTMLECRLHVCFIGSNHDSYEALSYCWREERNSAHDPQRGEHAHRPIIQCNGVLMEVGINLHLALHQLRNETSSRAVWADAVCINQSDVEERSEQVALMAEIYRRAHQVFVWLGPEPASYRGNTIGASDDSNDIPSQAFDMVCSIVDTWARETDRFDIGRPRYKRPGAAQDAYGTLPLDKPHWKKLEPLLSNSWFTRMWVVQEIALSRQATAIWGGSEISWELIGLAAAIIRTNWTYIGPWGGHNGIGPHQVPVGVMNAYFMYRISSFRSNLDPLRFSFCELLALTKQFECQEKHDKIFALLGLETSDRAKLSIIVDYSRPLADLYRSVALAILRSRQPLAILAYVHHKEIPGILKSDGEDSFDHNRENHSPTGESWIPRWDIDQPQTLGPLEGHPHFAAGLYRPVSIQDIEYTSKGGPLVIRGVILDHVRCKGSVPMTLEQKDSREQPAQTGLTRAGLEKLELTLSAGKDWYGTVVASPHKTLADFAKCLRRGFLWWALSQDAFGPSVEDDGPRKANCGVDPRLASIIPLLIPSENGGIVTLHDLKTISMPGDGDRFLDATIAACTGRSLFTTNTGMRGLGPACMQPGDKVCPLFRASIPFIIHECQGGQGHRLVGESYIHDLMRGQAKLRSHEHTWIKLA